MNQSFHEPHSWVRNPVTFYICFANKTSTSLFQALAWSMCTIEKLASDKRPSDSENLEQARLLPTIIVI